MAYHTNMVKIDGAKLKDKMYEFGFTRHFLAKKLGVSPNTLGYWFEKNYIPISTMEQITEMFDITYEDVKPPERKPEPKPEPRKTPVKIQNNEKISDEEKLYRVVFAATYNAMKRAMSEKPWERSIVEGWKDDQ